MHAGFLYYKKLDRDLHIQRGRLELRKSGQIQWQALLDKEEKGFRLPDPRELFKMPFWLPDTSRDPE